MSVIFRIPQLFYFVLAFIFNVLPHQIQSSKILDSHCDALTVDAANENELYQLLQSLKRSTFFRTFKVSLSNECPFWNEPLKCSKRGCSVCGECSKDEIPPQWLENDDSFLSIESTSSPVSIGFLGSNFKRWSTPTDSSLWIEMSDQNSVYINMQQNPEGYTGYEGDAPHKIWNAIYQQNCFQEKIGNGYDRNSFNQNHHLTTISENSEIPNDILEFQNFCYEQRVFYRIISGLHAGISVHIAHNYPLPQYENDADFDPKNATLCGLNIDVFDKKVGNYPERINNIYFVLVILLRSINKAKDKLLQFDYSTGNINEDEIVQQQLNQLLSSSLIPKCQSSESFDESLMFQSEMTRELKSQFKNAFRNISRIMDCVGCEKCRLHGKLQILGIGTALRILFEPVANLRFDRNEIMALFAVLTKFSTSIHVINQIRRMKLQKKAIYYVFAIFTILIIISLFIFIVNYYRQYLLLSRKRKIKLAIESIRKKNYNLKSPKPIRSPKCQTPNQPSKSSPNQLLEQSLLQSHIQSPRPKFTTLSNRQKKLLI